MERGSAQPCSPPKSQKTPYLWARDWRQFHPLFQASNPCNFLRTLAKLQPCNHNNPSMGELQVGTLGVTTPSPCETHHLQFSGLGEARFVLLVLVVGGRGFRAEGTGGRLSPVCRKNRMHHPVSPAWLLLS